MGYQQNLFLSQLLLPGLERGNCFERARKKERKMKKKRQRKRKRKRKKQRMKKKKRKRRRQKKRKRESKRKKKKNGRQMTRSGESSAIRLRVSRYSPPLCAGHSYRVQPRSHQNAMRPH